MVYRIHVTASNKSLTLKGGVDYAGAIVKVKDGISYLTLKQAAADPNRSAPREPQDANTVMRIARRAQLPARLQRRLRSRRRRGRSGCA